MIRELKIGIVFLMAILLFISCKHKQKEIKTSHKKHSTVKTKTVHEHRPENKGSEGELALEQKLGLTHREIQNDKLYSFVSEWYGVPYKYGGCEKSGVDCSCFTCNLYSSVFKTTLNRTAGDMFKACEQVGSDEAKQGDLYFFKISGDKISHVGVCLKGNLFVHASTSKGVIINSIEEAYYKKYFFCAGRIKKT